MKKNCERVNLYVSTAEQKSYYRAKKSYSKALKKRYSSLQDRFLQDDTYRSSQLKIGWTEGTCDQLDPLAQENHTYNATREKRIRYKGLWCFTQHNPVQIRQQLANVKTILNQSQKFVRRKVQPSSGENISAHIQSQRVPQRSKSQSQEPRPQPHDAHLLSPGKPGANVQTSETWHSWWSSSASNWWHGWQDWHSSSLFFYIIFRGVSLMKDSDLHMSDGVCEQYTASARAQHTTVFSRVPFMAQR